MPKKRRRRRENENKITTTTTKSAQTHTHTHTHARTQVKKSLKSEEKYIVSVRYSTVGNEVRRTKERSSHAFRYSIFDIRHIL